MSRGFARLQILESVPETLGSSAISSAIALEKSEKARRQMKADETRSLVNWQNRKELEDGREDRKADEKRF
jgi:hypothetical protein